MNNSGGKENGDRGIMHRREYLAAIAATITVGSLGDDPDRDDDNGGGGSSWTGFGINSGFANAAWAVRAADSLEVVTVTNLDASGEGSLEWAVNYSSDPTLVVFEVGGVIDRQGETYLRASEPNTFVAGQTAPDPGITIIRGGVRVQAENIIVQHLRVRVGDQVDDPGKARAFTFDDDSRNVIADRCSLSWATDQTVNCRSNGDGADYYTLSNCLLAEGLYESTHPETPHSRAFHIHYDTQEVCALGNVMAHHNRRHAYAQGNTSAVFANNYIYNFGERLAHLGSGPSGSVDPTLSFAGNLYEEGANSQDAPIIAYDGDLYWYDNAAIPSDREAGDGTQEMHSEPPLWPRGLTIIPTSVVKAALIPVVGARSARRTQSDMRVLSDAVNGTGEFIDSQSEVGGYPDLPETSHSLSVPSSGRLDWLQAYTDAVTAGVVDIY